MHITLLDSAGVEGGGWAVLGEVRGRGGMGGVTTPCWSEVGGLVGAGTY